MSLLQVINPATGEHIENITETNVADVPLMYEKSRNAFQSWSQLAVEERLQYLKKLKEVMVQEMDAIAKTIVKDTGKVPTEALVADIMPSIDAVGHIIKHAKAMLKPHKAKTPLLLIGKKSYVEYMARGVVLVISPWNYPLQLAFVPMISALASGNSVILKPSEVTPLVGKCIEQLFQKAGFPEAVVQVAHGGKELGAAFTAGNPDYIFFTGSVKTGKIIQEVAAKQLIPTTLELGGKDPFIVFADANLKRAAKGAVWAAFTNSGQVCMSAERMFVERTVYDEFLQLVKKETEILVQGTDENADIGSMTFPGQVAIVKQQVQEALEKGAQLESGIHPEKWDKQSMFIKPIILTNVHMDMEIVREETFGPVMPIIPFDTEEEAIILANQSEYGLNASVWTQDSHRARRVARQLISGAVTINEAIVSVANHYLPFGGAKHSGIGRYHGEQGLRMFCHEKAIVMDRGKRNQEIQWYPYKGTYSQFLQLFQSYFAKKTRWGTFLKSYVRLLKK
ncbi:aldehyde dehydrogenase family protein [Caldibacillus lycopersici]|uniref:Aldehyde dehydrogenase n=1 Tax=Perspicuibacillus lycopersici TaxID=1325689 RepID=A0AAE3ISR5_9BACI|nr:aldehyde dehydrogenase family protein [Perspicuibacillus lycopersici]MCU9613786.1 aldehyde dehydrogenase family protein [Perspicuibacillus lycopersici]